MILPRVDAGEYHWNPPTKKHRKGGLLVGGGWEPRFDSLLK